MGRRPNALILQYFERGPKLQDQSNRYPHTCKACGEHFPRGRLDSLINHITKKCPGISETERVNIILAFSGIKSASHRIQQGQQGQGQHSQHDQHDQLGQLAHHQANGSSVDMSMAQHEPASEQWSALGLLAEVSRQINNQEEKNNAHLNNAQSISSPEPSGPHTTERFEVQQPFTTENQEHHAASAIKDDLGSPHDANITAEERFDEEQLQEMLRAENDSTDSANLSMAAAAAARLHPALLDPQLLGAEAAAAAEAATATAAATVAATAAAAAAATTAATTANSIPAHEESPIDQSPTIPTTTAAQPWGVITYATDAFQTSMVTDSVAHGAVPMARGGFRLDTNGAKSRHSRQRFTPERREQVKDVRKIGACIRCRILRKTCSKGEPCDTCRKVLSPRIWRSGCIRTKFTEQLEIYSASVQIVLAQGRVNSEKQSMTLSNHGLVVEACHFPDQPVRLQLNVLQRDNIAEENIKPDPAVPDNNNSLGHPIMMLDSDSQDIPAKIEAYMRDVLPELIRREPSQFIQVTLRTALEIASTANDELLKKALELWGFVELLDRERQWTICTNVGAGDAPPQYIKENSDDHVFTTICLQLAAAVERKAGSTSKALLTGMQRVLQDSKVKIDFNMYLATMILLNCVEKSTWAFKAWEQPNLRPLWPLPKEPGSFAQQGYVIADLLRMLLGIRRAIPRTGCREADGKLITEEDDPIIKGYFEAIDLNFAEVKAKQEKPVFSPTDPRSFELLFCSTLLLPSTD